MKLVIDLKNTRHAATTPLHKLIEEYSIFEIFLVLVRCVGNDFLLDNLRDKLARNYQLATAGGPVLLCKCKREGVPPKPVVQALIQALILSYWDAMA